MVTCLCVRRAELKAALELDRVISSAAGSAEQAAEANMQQLVWDSDVPLPCAEQSSRRRWSWTA